MAAQRLTTSMRAQSAQRAGTGLRQSLNVPSPEEAADAAAQDHEGQKEEAASRLLVHHIVGAPLTLCIAGEAVVPAKAEPRHENSCKMTRP